jgi:hypothetical protein
MTRLSQQGTPGVWTPHAIALLLYTLLTGIVTWPLLLHLPTHLPAIPGEAGEDVWQNIWNIWWISKALLGEMTNPYYTHWLFYPEGTSLYLHSLRACLELKILLLGYDICSKMPVSGCDEFLN